MLLAQKANIQPFKVSIDLNTVGPLSLKFWLINDPFDIGIK